MEFSLPLPEELDMNGILSKQWTEFTERFQNHRNVNGSQDFCSSSSILLFAAHHHIKDIMLSLQRPEMDLSLLRTILETVEKYCLPHFLLLFERFRYFSLVQDPSESIDDFVQILNKQLEICEFGELKQKTMNVKNINNNERNERLKQNLQGCSIDVNECGHEEILSMFKNEGSKTEDCSEIQTEQNQKGLEVFSLGECAEKNEDENCPLSVLLSDKEQQVDVENVGNCQGKGIKKYDAHCSSDLPQNFGTRNVGLVKKQKQNKLPNSSSVASKPKVCNKMEKAKLFECFICKKNFVGTKCLQKHILSKHGNHERLLCTHCNASFTDLSEYIDHCKLHVSKQAVVTNHKTATLKQKNKFQQPYCSTKFSKEADLIQHSACSHSQGSNYLCWKCGELLPDLRAYRKHCEKYVVKAKFSCDMCQKKYHSITRLFGHLRNHLSPRLKCNVCGIVFSKPQYLENHMNKHTNEPAHECGLCGKSFALAVRLQYHMRTHSGEKRYICELCGKSFSQKMSFDYHRRWHAGEKPYECDVCGKQYRSSGDLSRHKGKHSNKRSHVCEHCGKGFRYSSSLVEHRKGHSDVRSYQCKLCLKTFIYRSGLRNHIKESRCSGKVNEPGSSHLVESSKAKSSWESAPQADSSSVFKLTFQSPDAFPTDLASWPFLLRGEDSGGINEIGFSAFTSTILNIRQDSLL